MKNFLLGLLIGVMGTFVTISSILITDPKGLKAYAKFSKKLNE